MTTLSSLHDLVWSHLTRGKADRKHPARHPTLATIGPNGPELRTLVLRRADPIAKTLELHTDSASPKVAQINIDPRVALHVWVPKERLQIRLRALAQVNAGDQALFNQLPPEAQANYGGPMPGRPLPTPDGGPDPERFASIHLQVTEIDALVLSDPHIRAIYAAPDWDGAWVAP